MSAAASKTADANARRPAGVAVRVSEAVDLHYIAEYEQKLASEIETLERARARIDSLRLQIKQAKRHAADLKRNMTLREFVRRVSADYVAGTMIRGRRQYITNRKAEDREVEYLQRIVQAVLDVIGGQS